VPQVQVSFDIDANGLLQVSATDRTTGRQQSVSIQGGSNLSEDEVQRLLAEAEQKATEDRRKRSEIDRRNRAQTLVAQAERRLRDAALELGPYGADRQQRAVELALRQVQDLLAAGDLAELEVAVSELQEALYGLNRRLASERRSEAGGPLQGLKNTLGSLKDELFADDDWDDWDRGGSRRGLQDPWRDGLSRDSFGRDSFGRDSFARDSFARDSFGRDSFGSDSAWGESRWSSEPQSGLGSGWGGSGGLGGSSFESSRGQDRDRFDARSDWGQVDDRNQGLDRSRERSPEWSRDRPVDQGFDRSRERSLGRNLDLGVEGSVDWSRDQPVDWSPNQLDNRSAGQSGDRWSERLQEGDGDQPVDRGFDPNPALPRERPLGRDADRPSGPGWDRQPDPAYGRHEERELDPYAGEGGMNPSHGPRRGEPMAARPRPPQDDPWAED
jgi:hypothetical protein